MGIKEIYNILKFLKNCKSCIILKDDLVMRQFGEYNETMLKFNDAIMHISIKDK